MMIIKALEQKPSDDCISRQSVLEMQTNYAEDIGATSFWRMRDDIRNLPSVIPQLKTGRWIVLKDEYGDIVEAVCSCCDNNGNHKYAFCPNCGAKIEG